MVFSVIKPSVKQISSLPFKILPHCPKKMDDMALERIIGFLK